MEEVNNHNSTVLKELSDVKASLAVNTNETSNIKASINEIKQDIREIKNETVSRREFNQTISDLNVAAIRDDVETLKEFRWKLAGITSLAAAGMTFIGQLIINFLIKK